MLYSGRNSSEMILWDDEIRTQAEAVQKMADLLSSICKNLLQGISAEQYRVFLRRALGLTEALYAFLCLLSFYHFTW